MLTFWVNNSIFHNHYPHTQTYILHTLSIPFTSCCVIFLYKRAAEGFLNILLGEKSLRIHKRGLLTYQNHKICMLKFIHISFVIHMYT